MIELRLTFSLQIRFFAILRKKEKSLTTKFRNQLEGPSVRSLVCQKKPPKSVEAMSYQPIISELKSAQELKNSPSGLKLPH